MTCIDGSWRCTRFHAGIAAQLQTQSLYSHFLLQGILTYPAPAKKEEEEEEKPGDRFEGSLVHGQRQGKGKYTWSNGCYYTGEYDNHMRHGHGTLIMPDKSKYEGWYCHQCSQAHPH